MTLYLIWYEPPKDFGNDQLLGIYKDKKRAERKLGRLRKQDPYRYQYLTLVPRRTID